jgi:hypothetical protein
MMGMKFLQKYLQEKKVKKTQEVKSRWTDAKGTFRQMQQPLSVLERKAQLLHVVVLAAAVFLPLFLGWLVGGGHVGYLIGGMLLLAMAILNRAGALKTLSQALVQRIWPESAGTAVLTDPKVIQYEAKQRCLRILSTMDAWQKLTPEDQDEHALQVVHRIYEIACRGESAISLVPEATSDQAPLPDQARGEEGRA